MSDERRRQVLLAVLVVILAFVALRTVVPKVLQLARAGTAAVLGRTDPGERAEQLTAQRVIDLRLDALEATPGDYAPARNLFRYGEPPKPPAPPPPPPRPRVNTPPPPPPQPRVTAPAAPTPPPVDLALLGIFGPERRRIVTFRQLDGDAIINALEGEVVNGRFIVRRIGLESVDLGFVGFPEDLTERIGFGVDG